MSEDLHAARQPTDLQVYWRPGCGYCDRLLRALDRANIAMTLHNIYQEREARDFVRAHNNGDETVPTVAYNGTVLTNPTPVELLELITSSQ